MNFIGNFFLFRVVQTIENRLRFDEVTTMSLVASFFRTRCICLSVCVQNAFGIVEHGAETTSVKEKSCDLV